MTKGQMQTLQPEQRLYPSGYALKTYESITNTPNIGRYAKAFIEHLINEEQYFLRTDMGYIITTQGDYWRGFLSPTNNDVSTQLSHNDLCNLKPGDPIYLHEDANEYIHDWGEPRIFDFRTATKSNSLVFHRIDRGQTDHILPDVVLQTNDNIYRIIVLPAFVLCLNPSMASTITSTQHRI